MILAQHELEHGRNTLRGDKELFERKIPAFFGALLLTSWKSVGSSAIQRTEHPGRATIFYHPMPLVNMRRSLVEKTKSATA